MNIIVAEKLIFENGKCVGTDYIFINAESFISAEILPRLTKEYGSDVYEVSLRRGSFLASARSVKNILEGLGDYYAFSSAEKGREKK